MSKVDASGNRHEDVVRQVREESNQKESELIKRHNKQLRHLTEQHSREIEDLKSTHSQIASDIKTKSRDEIFRREQKHAEEMDKIKNLHRIQSRKKAEENNVKFETMRGVSQNQKSMDEARYNERLDNLNKQYQKDIHILKSRQEAEIGQLRNSQVDTIKEKGNALKKEHLNEIQTLQKNRQKSVADLQTKLRDQRESYDYKIKSQNLQHINDKARLNSNFSDNILKERIVHKESSEDLREGFNKGLSAMREKFESKTNRGRADSNQALIDFKEKVLSRQENQIRGLETNIQKLKDEKVKAVEIEKNKKRTEVQNIRAEQHKQVEHFLDKDQARDDLYKRIHQKDINYVNQKNSDLLKNTGRYYRDKIQMFERKNKESTGNIKEDFELREKQNATHAERRVDVIKKHAIESEENLKSYFNDVVDQIREDNQVKNKKIIGDITDEHKNTESNIRIRAKENDIKHTERLERTIDKYKKEIKKLNAQNLKAKRSEKRIFDKTIENMQDLNANQLETIKHQYERRLAEAQEAHEKQLQTVNKRHQEQMNNLISVTKKS